MSDKEQTEEEKIALAKLFALQGKIKQSLFRGLSHRNIRRELGISLKDYIIIMALTEKK